MRALVVVETDPAADVASGVLYPVKVLGMDELLFQDPDNTLNLTVLLLAVGRDELQLQTVAFHQDRGYSTR